MSDNPLADAGTSEIVLSIFGAVQRSQEHTQSILDSFHADAVAEAHWLRHGLEHVLATTPWGGTTRQYEDALDRLRWLPYPPEDVKDYYREEAALYIKGALAGGQIDPHPRYQVRGER